MGVSAITLDRDNGELLLEDVSLKPIRGGLYAQATGLDLQDDVVEISLDKLQTTGLNSQAIFNGERAHLGGVLLLKNPTIALVRDKRLPWNLEKRPKMPQDIFQKLTKAISIDSVKIENGKLSYMELVGKEANEAKISFDSLHAVVTGLSEDWPNKNMQGEVLAQAHARLMGTGIVDAQFVWKESYATPLALKENWVQ